MEWQIRHPKAWLFDYGGTLDTGGTHWGHVLWQAWQQVGVPVSENQFREAYVYTERRLGAEPIIKPDYTFRQTLSAKLRLELEYVGYSVYHAPLLDMVYGQTVRHTAHSREVLRQLPQPKVLVSNFYGNLPTVLREFQLDTVFQQVVESAMAGFRKPDVRIFSLGIKALGLQPQDIAVVGDSIKNDMLPARQLGCQTVWLRGQQWTDTPADDTVADMIINDLYELI